MYSFILAPALQITWVEIGGIITFISFIAMIVWQHNKKLSKKTYYIDQDRRTEDINKKIEKNEKMITDVKSDLNHDIDCYEENNKGDHERISKDIKDYFNIVQEQIRTTREETNKKLDILIRKSNGL